MNKLIYTIKYYFYRFLKNFAFDDKTKNHLFRKKQHCLSKINPKKYALNKINGNDNILDINKILKYNIDLRIYGNNNKIILNDALLIKGNLSITIHGDNNIVDLGNIIVAKNLNILVGFETCKAKNCTITIGKKSRFVDVEILLLESNSRLLIGEDTLFSENIKIHLSDTHSIFDLNGNLINYGGNVEIKDRVWVCRDVKIFKKAKISSDSVVAANSIVTTDIKEPNVIIAGIPANIIKRGITWDCKPPQYSKDRLRKQIND